MTKRSLWCMLAIAAGALAMQGCAQTGAVRPPAGPTLTPAQQAAMQKSAAEIPTNTKGKPVVRADNKDHFEVVAAAIHQQMQPGGRWQYIDRDERQTIDGSFADMRALFNKYGSVSKMDRSAINRMVADQDTINAILTRRDGDRLICHEEMPVGSHLPVRHCRTYAQIQAEQQQTQRALNKLNQRQRFQVKTGH